MKLNQVEVSKLKTAKYNPRDIAPEAMEALQESIRQFGVVDPLIRNLRTGRLVGGHQRLKAAKLEGLKKVPVIDIDVDEDREKAINIVLNNPKLGGYYTEGLAEIVSELSKSMPDIDFEALKFDVLTIQSMIVSSDWSSDINAINGQKENLDGIKVVIRILCPQATKGEVLGFIKDKLAEAAFDGVEIA